MSSTRIQTVVYPRLTAEGRVGGRRSGLSPFLEDDEQFPFSNVLRHGDMGMSNILYSAEQGRFVGVVDFSHAGDWRSLRSTLRGCMFRYGEPFMQRFARVSIR